MDFVNSDIWRDLFVLPGNQIPVWAEVVRSVLRLVIGVLGALGTVPVLVWAERRLLALAQGRLGPNRVGPFGLLQPFADALKLMLKEDITPTNVDKTLYYIAPIVALVPVIMSVTVLPWNASNDWGSVAPGLNIGILFLLAVASIEVYGVILAGWSSNNKYSLLGGLRAASQVISYELGLGLAVICVVLMTGSLGTQDIVRGYVSDPNGARLIPAVGSEFANGQAVMVVKQIAGSHYTMLEHQAQSGFWDWNFLRLFPLGMIAAFVYMVSMIAETNRAPFDLPEAETELVAGFHTEYSSFKFAMFFMGEYANMLIVSAICVTLFFGGYLAPFGFLSQIPASFAQAAPELVNVINHAVIAPFWFVSKLAILIGFFILVRASYPRLRYDMLMRFGWKFLLPTALVNVFLIALSMALQQQFQSLPAGKFLGHALAVVTGLVIVGLVINGVRLGYNERHKDEIAPPLPGNGALAITDAFYDANRQITPIRRPSTVTVTERGKPATEI
ncbi:MAG: NADH-quinone oxidoreductase subunit H [Fibrella sp.]|nr:NADH-quinone oxidoreductase subunit H [Armatimonadota bacterium]